ncbi:MAG: hypothetical protein ABI233_00030, partial [Chthoniobacterales bacterium]
MHKFGVVNPVKKATVELPPQERPDIQSAVSAGFGRFLAAHWLLPYAASFLVIALSFATDAMLPRGATSAIGYCLVPVLAGVRRRRRTLLLLTAICTILTWVGYFLEPVGGPRWASVFDRAMVTAVLWLTL